jgi:hypothetical protein
VRGANLDYWATDYHLLCGSKEQVMLSLHLKTNTDPVAEKLSFLAV